MRMRGRKGADTDGVKGPDHAQFATVIGGGITESGNLNLHKVFMLITYAGISSANDIFCDVQKLASTGPA